ncbi:hypothetical protein PMAYCL1PPCAC_10102, partial [Pristionchus mayeri]
FKGSAATAMDSSRLLSKYLDEKEGNSVKFMQRMLFLIFAEVVYQRELLPQEDFLEKSIFGCTLHVPNPNKDRRQLALHNHLKGAADAVTGKKLKQCHLMVHKDRDDPSAASEVFIMEVVYADDEDEEASMQMSSGALTDVRVCYKGVEDLQKQTKDVFRCIRKGLSSLEPIRRNVSFSFYIMYREGVDRAFHPAGYAQAAHRYVLPETAEIGEMGMVHAKEHACLLKVKSLMLEDGFQLMQRNAATQLTDSTPGSDPSQASSDEMMSSDKASSLGVFDDHSEWDEPEESGQRDQRSLGGPSARTIRFEQSPSILDQSMSERSETSMASVELGTAIEEDFLAASQSSQQIQQQPVEQGRGNTTAETAMSFATTQSMVTKKLAAAEEKHFISFYEQSPDSSVTFYEGSHSSSGNKTGSEESEVPRPVRKASLTKKKSLTKVLELSTESDETLNEEAEEPKKTTAVVEDHSSGKDADSEPSDAPKKVEVARKVATRRQKKETTVHEESMEVEKEKEAPIPKSTNRRGKKVKEAEDAVAEKEERGGSGRRKGAMEKNAVDELMDVTEKDDDEEEVPASKKMGRRGMKDKVAEDTVSEKARGGPGRKRGPIEKNAADVEEMEVKEEDDDEEFPASTKAGKGDKKAKEAEDTVSEK